MGPETVEIVKYVAVQFGLPGLMMLAMGAFIWWIVRRFLKALEDLDTKHAIEDKGARDQTQALINSLFALVKENTEATGKVATEMALQRERCERRAQGSDWQMPTAPLQPDLPMRPPRKEKGG